MLVLSLLTGKIQNKANVATEKHDPTHENEQNRKVGSLKAMTLLHGAFESQY